MSNRYALIREFQEELGVSVDVVGLRRDAGCSLQLIVIVIPPCSRRTFQALYLRLVLSRT
jgi:8-oxo-dGTP pyrophosphatase MutT (NUDIX family)